MTEEKRGQHSEIAFCLYTIASLLSDQQEHYFAMVLFALMAAGSFAYMCIHAYNHVKNKEDQ